MKNKNAILVSLGLLGLALSPSCSSSKSKDFSLEEQNVTMEQYQERPLKMHLQGLAASDLTYRTSDYSVASVNDGLLTSKSTGRATITVSYGEKSYSCSLVVTANRTGRALVAETDALSLLPGETKQLSISLKEAGQIVEGAHIVYESSLPEAIEVDENGLITAKKRGSGIVSAYCQYHGQNLTKDISVSVKEYAHQKASLAFMDATHSGSTLTPYEGDDKEDLGFAAGEDVYVLDSAGGYASRIFDASAFQNGTAIADCFAFRIRFEQAPTSGTSFYRSENRYWEGNEELLTSNTAFTFYDYRGRPVESLRLSKAYLCVINLRKISETDPLAMGFTFNGEARAYVGGAIFGSEDYLQDTYSLTPPEELPDLSYVYPENGSGLEVGTDTLPGIDKYWISYSSGTSAAWDDSIFENRVAIGGVTYAKYREYAFMQMDVIFTSVAFRSLAIWTGGYALMVSPNLVVTSSETETLESNDLIVSQGNNVVNQGTALQANEVYTFKIRIQKKNYENVAFGLSVNSQTKDPVYFANPNLTKF